MMIRILGTIALLHLHPLIYGQTTHVNQEKALAIEVLGKKTIKVGDTISIRIKNLSSNNRGFTIEAVSMSKDPIYSNAVYSAFFNHDSSFFPAAKNFTGTIKKE